MYQNPRGLRNESLTPIWDADPVTDLPLCISRHQITCAAQQQALAKNRQRCVRLTAALDAMSPLKVLTRGYAMAQTEGGQLLRQVEQVRSGDRFTLQLSDGRIRASVESTEQLGPQEGKGGSYERTE